MECDSTAPGARLNWQLENHVVTGRTLVISSTLFSNVSDWNLKATCHGQFEGLDDCQKDLNVIIYSKCHFVDCIRLINTACLSDSNIYSPFVIIFIKHLISELPEKVSLSTRDDAEPMIEGKNYTLQCDVQNAGPVQFLSVNWYKGQNLLKSNIFSEIKTFDNKSTTLTIFPSRNDAKTLYSCEAELRLASKNSLKVKSDPLNITVHCEYIVKYT